MLSLRTARTAVDCTLSLALQQMLPNERSRIRIETRSGAAISVTVHLIRIRHNPARYPHQLSAAETLQWAAVQKANGVALFKRSPRFAQRAFSGAAKALLSLRPFDDRAEDGVAVADLHAMYGGVCQNLAACLLQQERYEDVLYVLQAVTAAPDAPERAVYRRALAHFRLRQLDEASEQLERLNYAQNPEQRALHEQIVQAQSEYQSSYSTMVRKMFQ